MTKETLPRAGRVVAVGGGKGGVGKSVVSSNLAVAIAQTDREVVLVDADLGAANQHTLFGIDRPQAGLQALLARDLDSLQHAAMPTGVPNLRLIAGTGGQAGAANINHGQKQRVLRKIRELEADVVIIDVGAGVAFNTLDFFDLADQRLIVMTPQLTSIQNAYAFLKCAVYRVIHQLGQGREQRADIAAEANSGRPTENVTDLVKRLSQAHPDLVAPVAASLANFGAWTVGNYIFDDRDVSGLDAIGRMIRDYLGVRAAMIGWLRTSRRVHDSVSSRRPLLLDHPNGGNGKTLRQMAQLLLAQDVAALRDGRSGLFQLRMKERSRRVSSASL